MLDTINLVKNGMYFTDELIIRDNGSWQMFDDEKLKWEVIPATNHGARINLDMDMLRMIFHDAVDYLGPL